MMRKKVMGLMMALAIAGTVGLPAVNVQAAGLTQAASPDQVTYGTVSAADIEILRGLFDAEYYLQQNPDLAAIFGNDIEALFNHFCTLGVFEGRTCNPNFDPAAYASAYDDLSAVFGTDIIKYYEHYATVGVTENRTITTVAECAANGITVASLSTPEVKITPAIYKIAAALGTTDYAAVQTAVERAAAQAAATNSAVAISSGDTTVVVTPSEASNSSGSAASNNSSTSSDADTSGDTDTSGNSDASSDSEATSDSGDNASVNTAAYTKASALGSNIGTVKLSDGTSINIFIVKDSNSKLGAYKGVTDEDYDTTYEFIKGETDFEENTTVVRFPTGGTVNVVATISPSVTDATEMNLEGGATGDIPTSGALLNITAEDPSNNNEDIAHDTFEATETSTYTDEIAEYTAHNDANATANTSFDIGFDFQSNEDKSVSVKVGISDSENEFGCYAEYTISATDGAGN